MTGTRTQKQFGDGTAGLPQPCRESRWRWSGPRQAMVAGGALAAVLGIGVATGATSAGAATTSSGNAGTAAHGRPPSGMARPTVAGKITALSGDTITVETNGITSATIVTSSSTTYKTNPGANGGTASSASALKVGEFIGVQGTKNSDGTVSATSVVIGRPPQMGNGGKGGPRGATGRAATPPSGAPTA